MADASDNYVEITFDGKHDKFELTVGEIEELEEAFDKPVGDINFERIKAIRMVVGFALRRRQPHRPVADIDAEMGALSMTEFERRTKPADPAPPTKAAAKAKGAAGSGE